MENVNDFDVKKKKRRNENQLFNDLFMLIVHLLFEINLIRQ